MTQNDAPITVVSTGPAALSALAQAVDRAQAADRFARVVVITDHHDVARSVRHRLGMQGMINVTVQTGRRLAAELARPTAQPLTRLLESQAVRRVAETTADGLRLEPAGRHRLYRSLAAAFREMQDRPNSQEVGGNVVADEMNRTAEALYDTFLRQVRERGYFPPAELPQLAVAALADQWPTGREPAVIYYLPRRMSVGDVQLAQGLLDRGKCQVIVGFTGDEDADSPARELLGKLRQLPLSEADGTIGASPLEQKAAADTLTIVATPDPEEEVRTVIRRIVASAEPFHRTAIVYRQENPYASLLRQELEFAHIPFSGNDYRRLADTPSGLLLLGIVDLAARINATPEGGIERERLIDWITSTPVRWPHEENDDESEPRPMTIPATRWANLARSAWANGGVDNWGKRLDAYVAQQERREEERGAGDAEDNPFLQGLKRQASELRDFVNGLASSLVDLGSPSDSKWESAACRLRRLVRNYRWLTQDEPEEDRRRIDEIMGSLAGLQDWGAEFSLTTLQEAISEALQSPVSDRGRSVGDGVYLGPPSGIVGADYGVVYGVGMVERQFPPRPRANPWLAENPGELQRQAALERYDFLAAIGAAEKVVLCWPASTADRNAAYPSRWLIEAANHLHERNGRSERLTHESLIEHAASKPWLTVIPSRTAGLRFLSGLPLEPADDADYNLLHLIREDGDSLPAHPAIASDARMTNALTARDARNGSALTPWDGWVLADSARVATIGSREWPISPSALETWATCPYKFFLSLTLGLSAPPEDEEDTEISALERGSLVHKILERFIEKESGGTETDLLALAEEEFGKAEERGITGHHLLWEIAKADIRSGLSAFLAAESDWFTQQFGMAEPEQSKAEVSFGPPSRGSDQPTDLGEVSVSIEGVDAPVWFRGKIDRVDVLGDRVLVRDFKTGSPRNYTSGSATRDAYTVANGRALQLPVYVEAARNAHRDAEVAATYCFPLEQTPILDARAYDAKEGIGDFHTTLQNIIVAARSGIFPATPDGDAEHGNCKFCDFKRLCPARRRQMWERKARYDDRVQPFNQLGGKAALRTNDDSD